MPNVQICWTKDVSEAEAAAVQTGVREVLQYVSTQFSVHLMGGPCDADSWAERCLKKTDRSYGRQVDAECVLTGQVPYSVAKYAADTGQTLASVSCLTVAVISADLTAGDANFLFGASKEGFGSVVSVARLRADIEDTIIREKVLRRLARHEFGHALGLIPEERPSNVEEKIGLHCTNLCTMRQGMSLSEFVGLVVEEEKAGVLFCSECAGYLRSGLANLKILLCGEP